jgi:hypothetical protein
MMTPQTEREDSNDNVLSISRNLDNRGNKTFEIAKQNAYHPQSVSPLQSPYWRT